MREIKRSCRISRSVGNCIWSGRTRGIWRRQRIGKRATGRDW